MPRSAGIVEMESISIIVLPRWEPLRPHPEEGEAARGVSDRNPGAVADGLRSKRLSMKVLHQRKVIHRDLKTENILVNDGVYKIASFGLAENTGSLTTSTRRDKVGSRISMAPEVQNDKPYDAQADLWSLGVVYYEILAGNVPFNGPVT